MFKDIQNRILKISDPQVAESGRRFFKEEIKIHGVKTPDVQNLAREYFSQIDKMEKSKIFELCESLIKTDYQEEFFIACAFVYRIHKKFEKSDFAIFEKWVKSYINNWAKCDTFCNHTMGSLIEKFPVLISDIKKWSQSKNLWVRRASAVTFILPARHGKFIDDVFEIADSMLTDPADMVQKGYGWALKAASEKYPKRVYDFVIARVDEMPRTAYRYAIEKLPAEMKKKAMKL